MTNIYEMKSFLSYDGCDLRYMVRGCGKPLVFIHGFASSSIDFSGLFKLLEHKYRIYALDQRGFGQSPVSGNLGIESSARDLKALVDKEQLEDFNIIAYSMGAHVLFSYIELFGEYKIGNIILGEMSPKLINEGDWSLGLYQGWYTRDIFERDLKLMDRNYRKFNEYFLVQTLISHCPEEKRDFLKEFDINQWLDKLASREKQYYAMIEVDESQARINRQYWKTMVEGDYRSLIGHIKSPICYIYGKPGSIYNPKLGEYYKKQLPNIKLYEFEDANHLLIYTHRKAFVEVVDNFINEN